MQLASTQQSLSKQGISELLSSDSNFKSVIVQIASIQQRAMGYLYRCELYDRTNRIKVAIKHDSNQHKKLEIFDVIEIQKEDIEKIVSEEGWFILIEKIKIIKSQAKLLGNRKPTFNKINSQNKQLKQFTIQQVKQNPSIIPKRQWKIEGKIIYKSPLKNSKNGSWFDCALIDKLGNKIDLIFFDKADLFHKQVHNNMQVSIERPTMMKDKHKDTAKIKILSDTKIIVLQASNSVIHRPINNYSYEQNQDQKNLSISSQIKDKTFNKMAYCIHIQPQQLNNSNRPKQAIHLIDEFNNVKKLAIWPQHNIIIPFPNSFVLILNISNKGKPKSDTFFSTKQTKIIDEIQALQKYGIILNTFNPNQFAFYRRVDNNQKLSNLSDIFKDENKTYFVVATLLLDLSEIKLSKRCKTCNHIHSIGIDCNCHNSNLQRFYNVKCVISDDTGSTTVSIFSTALQIICRINSSDTDIQVLDKLRKRMISLNFSTQLLKLNVKKSITNDQRIKWYINVLDIFTRDISKEIQNIKQTMEKI